MEVVAVVCAVLSVLLVLLTRSALWSLPIGVVELTLEALRWVLIVSTLSIALVLVVTVTWLGVETLSLRTITLLLILTLALVWLIVVPLCTSLIEPTIEVTSLLRVPLSLRGWSSPTECIVRLELSRNRLMRRWADLLWSIALVVKINQVLGQCFRLSSTQPPRTLVKFDLSHATEVQLTITDQTDIRSDADSQRARRSVCGLMEDRGILLWVEERVILVSLYQDG